MRRALGLVLVVGASALRPPTSPLRPPTRAQRALGARAPPEALPRQRRRAKLWPFVSSACALGTRPLRARAMNLAVSLDQPLVKSRGGLSAIARAASGALVPLLALALTLRLVRTVARALIDDEYYDDEDDDEVEEEEEEEYDDAEEDEAGSLGLGSFSLRGFLANTVAGVRAVFDELFPLDVEWLPETEWTTVSLAGSTDLGAGFMRYRFTYPSGEDQMPLEIAQPLSLWGFAGNKYCRANYVPVSSREARGHFEIITSSSERLARLAASRNSTSDDTSFVDFIENMAIGQEIVAKPGSTKFAYVGRHEITHFRCFVAELGAVPALQLASEVLPERSGSSVEDVEVFWVNENDEEFVLYDKFNSLYRRFKSKMAVNFYDDAELYSDFNSAGSLFERDAPELQEALSNWRPGVVAALSGPDVFVKKVRGVLLANGFPETEIVSL